MAQNITTDAVRVFNDFLTERLLDAFGGSNHYGYWEENDLDSEDLVAASDRMTSQVVLELSPGPRARLLDVGCGNGKPAIQIATAYDVYITGIAVSDYEITKAVANLQVCGIKPNRITFQHTDATELAFDDASFDGAYALESLLFIPNKTAAIVHIARILRPGGRLIIADFFAREPANEADSQVIARFEQAFKTPPLITVKDCENIVRQAGLRIVKSRDATRNIRKSHETVTARLMGIGPIPDVEAQRLLDALINQMQKKEELERLVYAFITAERT